MRNRFADVFYELAQDDPRLCIVVADISPAGSIAKFRTEFPERFVNTGVAEQVMIGMAAGMAQRGFRPFAYTIATFTLYRPFEFVRDDLCYQELPVTIVGIGGGVTYSTLGGTHHAMEDVAIATALPGMQVIAPTDPAETEAASRWCAAQTTGPCYLRLGKAGEPDLTADAPEPWRFGKLRRIQNGGTDLAVISYGPIAKMALDVAESAREQGLGVSSFFCSTLKPLDRQGIVEVLKRHQRVAIVEETTPSGALGGAVKQIAFEEGLSPRIDAFSLQDKFIHVYGNHTELLAAHGLSASAIKDRLFGA